MCPPGAIKSSIGFQGSDVCEGPVGGGVRKGWMRRGKEEMRVGDRRRGDRQGEEREWKEEERDTLVLETGLSQKLP